MDASAVVEQGSVGAGVPEPAADEAREGRRIEILSAWMIALGTVILVCAVGDSLVGLLEWLAKARPAGTLANTYLRDHSPLLVVAMCWPLGIGLIVRRTGDVRYLRMAALTFLALSLGGAWNIVQATILRSNATVLIGSFAVPLRSLATGSPGAWALALAGIMQLVAQFIVAVRAWKVSHAVRSTTDTVPLPWDRVRGRLAFYLALVFVLVCVREPIWNGYESLVNRSDSVRTYVIRSAPRSGRPVVRNGAAGGDLNPDRYPEAKIRNASELAEWGRFSEAAEAYERAIAFLEKERASATSSTARGAQLAQALNNLAWLYSTCEDLNMRKPAEAIALAERAVKLAEDEGNYWNTLGAAYCRSARWDDARRALSRSIELRGGRGDAFDWYFLAMVEWQDGHRDRARDWYDKAVAWGVTSSRPEDPELRRFHAEAAQIMGLPVPADTESGAPGRPRSGGGIGVRRPRP